MSDTLLAGLPVPFEWKGKTYYLGSREYSLDLAFQQFQEGHARRRILAHRKEMGEEEYAEQMKGWRHELGSNAYAFGGKLSWAFLWSEQGFKEYVWLKVKKGEAECADAETLSRDDLDALFRDEAARLDIQLIVTEMDFPNLLQPEGRNKAASLRLRKKIGAVPPVTGQVLAP